MTNELVSSHLSNNMESLTANENHPISSMRSGLHSDLLKVSSSSQPLSLGDHQTYSFSNFQDPLFSQLSSHIYSNREQGFDRGDRNQSIVELKLKSNEKPLGEKFVIGALKCKSKRMKKEKEKKKSQKQKHRNRKNTTLTSTRKSNIGRQLKMIDRRGKNRLSKQKINLGRMNARKMIDPVRSTRKYHLPKPSVTPHRLKIRSKSKRRMKNHRIGQTKRTLSRNSITPIHSKYMKKGSRTREQSSLDKNSSTTSNRQMLKIRKSSTSKIMKKRSTKDFHSSKTNLKKRISSKSSIRSRSQSQRNKRRKMKFPRCTSKTLITIAPSTIHATQMVKSKTNLKRMKKSPSVEIASVPLSLTKNSAQLNCKNNNNNRPIRRHYRKKTNRVQREPKLSMKRGMKLRSRTILFK